MAKSMQICVIHAAGHEANKNTRRYFKRGTEKLKSASNGQMNVVACHEETVLQRVSRREGEAGRGRHFVGHLRMFKMQFKMIYVFVVWTTEC